MAKRVDLTVFDCGPQCQLQHERCPLDWVAHFLASHKTAIDRADFVLIERQPPAGHKAIEQLILQGCRAKAVFIEPCSFHVAMNTSHLNYDDRKIAIEMKARLKFGNSMVAMEALDDNERCHDIADSLMFCVYFTRQPSIRAKLLPSSIMHRAEDDGDDGGGDPFQQFYYVKRGH